MVRKTLIKKACKQHFEDIYTYIEEDDNEQYDPEVTTMEQRSYIDEIAEIDTIDELKEYWNKNKGKWEDFAKAVNKRKIAIIEESKKAQENITLPPQ